MPHPLIAAPELHKFLSYRTPPSKEVANRIDAKMKTDAENYRKQFDPIPSRSETIRQLIAKALAAQE